MNKNPKLFDATFSVFCFKIFISLANPPPTNIDPLTNRFVGAAHTNSQHQIHQQPFPHSLTTRNMVTWQSEIFHHHCRQGINPSINPNSVVAIQIYVNAIANYKIETFFFIWGWIICEWKMYRIFIYLINWMKTSLDFWNEKKRFNKGFCSQVLANDNQITF